MTHQPISVLDSLRIAATCAVLVCGIALVGCHSGDSPAVQPAASAPAKPPATANQQATSLISPPSSPPTVAYQPPPIRPAQPAVVPPSDAEAERLFGPPSPKASLPPKPVFDEGKLRAAGIRRLESKHLVLYTDLPPAEAIDEFPRVFDLAVPLWCEYFKIDPANVADWQMIGCLIDEQNRFAGAGLMPDNLPPFPNGYHRDWQFWVYQKPGGYYTRHLVLHEGTHGFMKAFLGNAGPPWFMEGMAEYLGTHKWKDGKLTLGYMPRDNDEVPYWGRVKIIDDDFAANRAESLDGVLAFGTQAHLRTEAYAWSWLAVTFLAEHPQSSQAFRGMFEHVNLGTTAFANRLKSELKDVWPQLLEDWQLTVVNIDYGYDIAANATEFGPGKELPAGGVEVEIDVSHGWQSSGYALRRGQRYRLTATGQYVIGTEPKPWTCEAGGVTIRYHRDLPLGMLLGAIRPEAPGAGSVTPMATPGVIGLSSEISPETDGVLYMSINEHPAEWRGNAGKVLVKIEPIGN